MRLEGSEWFFRDAARRAVMNHPELLRRVGVAVLNVAMQRTPPNRGVKKHPGKGDVAALKRRIEFEVLGGVMAAGLPRFDFREGRVLGEESWGAYAFRVPVNAGKARLDFVDPQVVLRKRRFRRKGNVVRAWSGRVFERPNWVRAKDLRAAVRGLQDRAGSLVGGWFEAAQALGASNARRDFFPGKQRRAGRVRLAAAEVVSELEMVSDWGDLIVARRFKGEFARYVRSAAAGSVRNVENWFLKKVFSR